MGEHQQRVVAGRYTLLRELGRGGMGVVWLAEDAAIGRRVAVKELLLPPGIPADERDVFEERVLREARTAGRLNDPGIVTVYDVQQEDGVTYIVMELIEAPDLAELVKRDGPLPAGEVLRIADGVLSALVAAHAAGVVHRDVKPSNVIVAPNGRVKLTDFGIAQSTDDPRLTTTGMLVGSPMYIAPERLLGQDASPASDLWAMGALLYFAAEGVGAYDRPITAAVIQAIVNERAEPHAVPPGPLADLITGLMDPDPETRLTADQARELIDEIPTADTRLIRKPAKRKARRGVAVAAAGVVLGAAVVAVLAVTGVFRSGEPGSSNDGTAVPPTVEISDKSLTRGPDGDTQVLGGIGCYVQGAGSEDMSSRDCAAPHSVEAFGVVDLGAQHRTYPANDKGALATTASKGCRSALADLRLKQQMIFFVAVPTKKAWDAGDHRGTCLVRVTGSGRVQGSVVGN